VAGSAGDAPAADGPRFNATGQLLPPPDYRNWAFVTTGFSMSYGPVAQAAEASGMQMLENVFVNRSSYEHFLSTGRWPDATIFILELREAEQQGSINQHGYFQTGIMGIEAHVKDSKRFEGGWGFFAFDANEKGATAPATMLPKTASCYSCHRDHAAVDTTFMQFYPTLLPIARAHGTVRADFDGLAPTTGELAAEVASGGWPSAGAHLQEIAKRWPKANVLKQGSLNAVGYQLLAADKREEAIAAFAYVTERFPQSANAWDSLSEANERAGHADAARAAAQKGLSLLDADPQLTDDGRKNLRKSLEERIARQK